MTSAQLIFANKALNLTRPGATDPTLRAWDAADELLLEQAWASADALVSPRVLVIDDQFGALTMGMSALAPTIVADSAALVGALAANEPLNAGLARSGPVRSWIDPPAGPFDLVLLRIPRQADYLAWLLRWLNGVLADSGIVLAGGMIKHLPSKSVEVFAGAVYTEQVLPARKKARVIRCRRGTEELGAWSQTWRGYPLPGSGAEQIQAMPAVFARHQLDIGTRLLLSHVAGAASAATAGSSVLDLACGNGVLGLTALASRQDIGLVFSDVSSQAVLSARRNVDALFPQCGARFRHCDGIPRAEGPFDLILLNPPFHEGGVVGDHIAMKLCRQAAECLKPNGYMLLVGNRHLGYHRSLRRFFTSVEQLDANPKFVVFKAGNA